MIAALLLTAAVAAEAGGQLCAEPGEPCAGFKPHDLSFRTPQDGVARAEARSVAYYAVILKSGARCRITERERQEAQALFPGNKVFMARFGCDEDVENNVTYTNIDPKAGFLAVHAGPDRRDGDAMLARVKATGKFPGANVRRMQSVLVFP